MTNNMNALGLWKMLYIPIFILPAWWHHWLCNERHLMPKFVVLNWWCSPTFIYTVMMCWHNEKPSSTYSKGIWKESVITGRKLDYLVRNIVDFCNHRKLTLRCFRAGITPFSAKLKSMAITSKSYEIIRK